MPTASNNAISGAIIAILLTAGITVTLSKLDRLENRLEMLEKSQVDAAQWRGAISKEMDMTLSTLERIEASVLMMGRRRDNK